MVEMRENASLPSAPVDEIAHGRVPAGEGRAQLAELLQGLFTAKEMERWCIRFAGDVAPAVHFDRASLDVAYALAEALTHRGLVAPALFVSLRKERPGRDADIEAVERALFPPPLLHVRYALLWAPPDAPTWGCVTHSCVSLPARSRLSALVSAEPKCYVWLAIDPFDAQGRFHRRVLFPLADRGGAPRTTRPSLWERLPAGERSLQEQTPALVLGWRLWIVAAHSADAPLDRLAQHGAALAGRATAARSDGAVNLPGMPALVPFVLEGRGALVGAVDVRFTG